MVFWIVAACLAVFGVLPVIGTLRRPHTGSADTEMSIYRDQMAEVDRDAARGLLSEEERSRARREVERRLLDADRRRVATPVRAPAWAARAGMGGAAVLVVLGTVGLYALVGAPGYGDLPVAERLRQTEELRRARPDQATAEAQADLPAPPAPDPEDADLIAQLRTALADRPNDLQGFRLLARNEARLGNVAAARAAQSRVVELSGASPPVDDLVFLAHLMVGAAGGIVTPQAEDVLRRIGARDPRNPWAQYYAGLGEAQVGRYDRSFEVWRQLLDASAPSDPWTPAIRAEIEDIAARAGIRYALPSVGPGPSAEDIAAAADMNEEDRAEMIEGMVGGLARRLAEEGGPASDWARLVRAYGQLGRQDDAAAIWAEAQDVFAPHPSDLDAIRAAARAAGVAE